MDSASRTPSALGTAETINLELKFHRLWRKINQFHLPKKINHHDTQVYSIKRHVLQSDRNNTVGFDNYLALYHFYEMLLTGFCTVNRLTCNNVQHCALQ